MLTDIFSVVMGKNKLRLSQRKQGRKDNRISTDHVTDACTQTGDDMPDKNSSNSDSHGVTDACTQTGDDMPDKNSSNSDSHGVTDATQTEDDMPVSTSDSHNLTDACTQTENDMPVNLQQHLMSPVAGSQIVCIPLKIFFYQRIHSLGQLHSRLVSLKVIENWFLVASQAENSIQLVRVNGQDVFALEITDELKWFLRIASNCLPSISSIFCHLPSSVESLQDIKSIVTYVDTCSVCKGNGDPKFTPLVTKCKGIFKDRGGKHSCYPVYSIMCIFCSNIYTCIMYIHA